jgi:hypothetical protein
MTYDHDHLAILMNDERQTQMRNDDVLEKDKNHHNNWSDGADNADKDFVYCLLSIFPNADNNPVG